MEVVKRNSGFDDEIEFSLRILNIEKKLCDILKLEFKEIGVSDISYLKGTNGFVVSISEIDKNSKHDKIIKIIKRLNIQREKVNFFISLTSQNDISGFTVPQKVIDLHLDIGGSIDFSVITYDDSDTTNASLSK